DGQGPLPWCAAGPRAGGKLGPVTATSSETNFGVHPALWRLFVISVPSAKWPPPIRSSAPAAWAAVSCVVRLVVPVEGYDALYTTLKLRLLAYVMADCVARLENASLA